MNVAARNKRRIVELYRASDAGDLDAIVRTFSLDFVDHEPAESRRHRSPGTEGLRQLFGSFYEAFPDTRHTLHDVIAEGDRVVVRVSADGTHSGSFFGIPATGLRVRNEAIVIYRLVGGLIVERWSREQRSVLEQLRTAAAEASQ